MMFTSKNLQLLIAAFIVAIVAFTYGLFPKIAISFLLDVKEDNINLKQVFRAIMGLYLGMAAFWITSTIRPSLWFSATLSALIFFGGLAFGRLIGILADGIPSPFFWFGMLIEFAMCIWATINLKKYHFSSFIKNPPPGAR